MKLRTSITGPITIADPTRFVVEGTGTVLRLGMGGLFAPDNPVDAATEIGAVVVPSQ